MLEDLSYIDCRDLLESTGIKNVNESGGEISFSCPSSEHFHGDNSPSARMNARTSAWLCHSCGMRGNGITFLAWHKSLPETVARRLIEERVKQIMNPEIIEEKKRIPPSESWLDNFYLDWRNKNWCQGCSPDPENENNNVCCGCAQPPVYKKYMYDRKFDPEILNKWEIGYDQLSDRITIPIRDIDGKLVGFKGRAWHENAIPKYMILGDYNNKQTRYGFQPYQKSKHVFGLNKYMKLYSHEMQYIILVEGELNVIMMDQIGYPATLGIAGSEFSDIQRNLIVESYCKQILLYLDNDKAGEKGTKKVIEMLSPYMPISIIQNAPGDAAELDKDEIDILIKNAKSSLELQVENKI